MKREGWILRISFMGWYLFVVVVLAVLVGVWERAERSRVEGRGSVDECW